MKFALTLGAAVAAITLTASAHTDSQRIVVRHSGGHLGAGLDIDANEDGWITRAEASAAADRIFDHMDSNDDGRLTREDRRAMEDVHVSVDAPDIDIDVDAPDVRVYELEGDENGERRVIIRRRGELTEAEEARIEREVERAMEHAERAREQAERHVERAERMAEQAERRAERAAREVERHVSREVIVISGDDHYAIAPTPPTPPTAPSASVAPVAPVPPRPPVFMMLLANSEEADLNGDGALSREEFRAQHLRFFDASDANGDGRIRFEAPPAPPVAPTPPAPPQPPRHR